MEPKNSSKLVSWCYLYMIIYDNIGIHDVFLFPRGAFWDHCVTVVCKFQKEICNKAFGFRSAPQGIGSHVLNPKNQAASRCSRATIITQGPSHCTTTSICTCLTYQHQQQPAGISVDGKQIVYCKMRSLLLGTWQPNAIKTRLCIITYYGTLQLSKHTISKKWWESWENCTSTCRYMFQSIARWLVGFFVQSEHLSQSTSAPPIQDGADKFLVCSSSKKILRQKLHDTQLGGIEQVNTEQVAIKIRAHKGSVVKSQSFNNQAKNPQNIVLVLFLRMDVNDSSDFFWKKHPTVRRILEYLEYSRSTSCIKTKLLMFGTIL